MLSRNLPFQIKNTKADYSIRISTIKIPESSEKDPNKVLKNNGCYFGPLNIHIILLKIEQLRSLLINSNI